MQKRIILSVILGMTIILISLGMASYLIVKKDIDYSLNNRLALAHFISNYIDNMLQSNITRLYDISVSGVVDLKDNNFEPERRALYTAYMYSIFTDGVFLLDKNSNVILTYPARFRDIKVDISNTTPVNRILTEGRPVVSNVYTVEPTKKKVMYVLVPLKDKNGHIVGIAGGEINPTNPMLSQVLKTIDIGKNTFVEIVDSNGVIIASTNPSRVLTWSDHNKFFSKMIGARSSTVSTCHRCHSEEGKDKNRSTDILAFAPLEMAPWGVSIMQPEKEVFAPAAKLRQTFFILGIIFMGAMLITAIGISRSIVKPVQNLISATDWIAKGDLSKPVLFQSSDELGVLSRSFEAMRTKLSESLENIRRYNLELERRVFERTQQIRYSQQRAESLLKKAISSQEEERKRIARELHDETLQDLSAILMKIEMCRLSPGQVSLNKIEEINTIILKTLDGIRSIIQNLRPSILDDLGLEAAIRWLLDNQLKEKEINYFFNIAGATEKRFDHRIEIILFRIMQEAITNIAKHTTAKNVFVILKADKDVVNVDIEDDGEGFDVSSVLKHTEDGRGLGLLGMKERASLLDGRLEICSSPGSGTRITLRVPLESVRDRNV